MENRVIDLSEEAAFLKTSYEQLILETETTVTKIPLADIAVLLVSHPAVHFTHSVISGICEKGGSFIVCNRKFMPIGMLLPLSNNYEQSRRFLAQADAKLPVKKQLWKQIISAKVRHQGLLLAELSDSDKGLLRMATKVKSGDPDNIESQASRRYWSMIFGESFRRTPQASDGINSMLNYGYAIMRSLTTRCITASGLHPTLGIHHHNQYNAFCLADDLMEPYRPIVDRIVYSFINESFGFVELDKESKQHLIEHILNTKTVWNKKSFGIFDSLQKLSQSLVNVYLGTTKKLVIPTIGS